MDKDVIYCYQEMIRNIRIVEDNEEDNEALENVRKSFFELFCIFTSIIMYRN